VKEIYGLVYVYNLQDSLYFFAGYNSLHKYIQNITVTSKDNFNKRR